MSRAEDTPIVLHKNGQFVEGLVLTFNVDALPSDLRSPFSDWLSRNEAAGHSTVVLPPAADTRLGNWEWLRWGLDSTQYRAGRLFVIMRDRATGTEGPRTGFNGWDFWRMPSGESVTAAARRFRTDEGR